VVVVVVYSPLQIACKTFGNFKPDFLADVHGRIKANNTVSTTSSNSKPVIDNSKSSDVLMLGNSLPGGLIKNKSSAHDQDRPIFKVPELPRASKLGLDVLADKKRAESNKLGQPKPKKVKMNWDDEEAGDQDVEMDDSSKMETPRK
jgi:pre-mRNA-splicing factor ATP-dependent RNA helicase DHX38/PRP16